MSRIEWEKIKISDADYETAGVLDVNNDGVLDIVSGGFWYEGPDWNQHKVCDVKKEHEYYNDFATIPMDVNGNGFMDVVSCNWFDREIFWRENPGDGGGDWKTHHVDECGNSETAIAWDVDGDGELEVVPNAVNGPLAYYKLAKDSDGRGKGEFEKIVISEVNQGHGLGFGDVTGNGKGDFVVANGWWEAPEKEDGTWTFHDDFELGSASVPILIEDINGDGTAELVVGNAHGYGLDYYTQAIDEDGAREWTKHPIDPYFSQYHCMIWVDIDGDGQNEIVTGSRYRAHNGNDRGETDEVGLYVFKWHGEGFSKQVVDHGRVPDASGAGLYFDVADIDGDGRQDIIAPGKEGLYLFKNKGWAKGEAPE